MNKNIHIIGAGLIGLKIAENIRSGSDIKNDATNILIHDQGETIISAWNQKKCMGFNINNGFHGIEYPRAALIKDYLNKAGCKELLTEIPTNKALWIEEKKVAFNSYRKEWPEELCVGLDNIINAAEQSKTTEELIKTVINSTTIGKSIQKCHQRFTNNIENCWHLFYPWFFPAEFNFSSEDEGDSFRNSVKAQEIKSTYLVPLNDTFESLKDPIKKRAESRGINFSLGHRLSKEDIEGFYGEKNKKLIWCASSFGLLNTLDKALANKCIADTRHLHLSLYALKGEQINGMQKELGFIPTEILCLDSNIPGLNRLSFINYLLAAKAEHEEEAILMAEYITHDKEHTMTITERIRIFIEGYLNGPVRLIGNVYGRQMHSLDSKAVDESTKLIEDYTKKRNIYIPEIYYGPINMAKCGMIAERFSVENDL